MTHSVDKPDISNAEFDVLDALWEDDDFENDDDDDEGLEER